MWRLHYWTLYFIKGATTTEGGRGPALNWASSALCVAFFSSYCLFLLFLLFLLLFFHSVSLPIVNLASEDVMNTHDEILGKKPRFLFISNTDSPINESHYIDYHRSVEKWLSNQLYREDLRNGDEFRSLQSERQEQKPAYRQRKQSDFSHFCEVILAMTW